MIAKALLTGQTAPADARDQVRGNLTAAQTALAALNSCVSLLPLRPYLFRFPRLCVRAWHGRLTDAPLAVWCRTDSTVSSVLEKAAAQLDASAAAGEGVVANCN